MSGICFMGLDVGTTGCKAGIFDARGELLGSAYREYPVLCDEPMKAEQDAELVFGRLAETMREARACARVDNIEAVGLSVQGDAVIPVDAEFRPLHGAILGMDYRPGSRCGRYAREHDAWELYMRTGQPLHPINMLSKIMWLQDSHPDIFERVHRFVTYAEFVMQRLGGEPFIDATMASRSMGYDLQRGDWSDELLANMGVTRGRLSEICESGGILGRMDAALARDIGLVNRPLLIAGGHDQPVGAVGAGAVRGGLAVDSTGTAEVLSVSYGEPRMNRRMFDSYYASYRHAVPGQYFSFAHMQVGGILQRWYRDNLAVADMAAAAERGIDFYAYAQSLCPRAPSSILVLPHFNGSGTPTCDLTSKGAIVGLSLATTRHDILKGIMDSLCYELRTNVEAMREAGIAVDAIRAVGGGARSPLWLQAKADILHLPIQTLRCKEAGCLGAAAIASVGAGRYGSIAEAAAEMVRCDATYAPDPAASAAYDERYEAYKLLYGSLCRINAALG